MRPLWLNAALCFALAAPAFAPAQTIRGDDSPFQLGNSREVTTRVRRAASLAPAAQLRGLDKLSGQAIDLVATNLEAIEFGSLTITMNECRYPRNNPSGDAFAQLTIMARGVEAPVFDGWMIASSPALVALDHPRYDVWVIRCKLDNRTQSVVDGESSPRPVMRP